jgi:hypothetical protein
MSTSLLYHGFDIVRYRYICTEYKKGDVIFTVSRKKFSLRCPVCKSKGLQSMFRISDGFTRCPSVRRRLI